MTVEEIPLENAVSLPYSAVYPNPSQPRSHFDMAKIEELRSSIREFGIQQPLIVRRESNAYDGRLFKVVAGGRRYMAAEGVLDTLPCIIQNVTPEVANELSLIENIQRENLTALEEARAVKELMSAQQLSIHDVAMKLSVSDGWVNNRIALLKTGDDVKAVAEIKPDSMSSLLLVDKVKESETRQELLVEVATGKPFSEIKSRVEAHQSAEEAKAKAASLSAPTGEDQSRVSAASRGESASMSRGRRVTGGASQREARLEAERHIKSLEVWVPLLSPADFEKLALTFARRITRGDLSR